jgi:hypothetical protein
MKAPVSRCRPARSGRACGRHGMALGLRSHGSACRVCCLLGDGELQEGEVWERLCSLPSRTRPRHDDHRSQRRRSTAMPEVMCIGGVEPSCGVRWEVREVDGHACRSCSSHRAPEYAPGVPVAVIARTVRAGRVVHGEQRGGRQGAQAEIPPRNWPSCHVLEGGRDGEVRATREAFGASLVELVERVSTSSWSNGPIRYHHHGEA